MIPLSDFSVSFQNNNNALSQNPVQTNISYTPIV